MTQIVAAAAGVVPSGVLSLVDPLPDESPLLVDLVAQTYGWTGAWPVWQYVAQQAFGKYGIDAEAVLRDLPQWPWGVGHGYRAVRTIPAAAGNAAPDIEARTVLTVYGLCYARDAADHPLVRAVLRDILSAGSQVFMAPAGGAGLICPAWTRGRDSQVRRASGCVPSLNLRKGWL